MTAAVATRGSVARVEVYLGSGAATASGPVTYTLSEAASGRWSATGRAPASAGDYHFTVALFTPAGRRYLKQNDSWNLTVGGGGSAVSPPGVTPAFPGDIPLAPPFSYGNPVPAVFNAGGASVNGGEVISTVRPDASSASVAQYYNIHLPRAGWTVTQFAPTAGAPSFSVSGTKGNRVCIIEYGASAVHIFYGTIGG